jgi:hypothetical protein
MSNTEQGTEKAEVGTSAPWWTFLGTTKPARGDRERASCWVAGGGLLSHVVSDIVPSALTGLTAVFGMGTGVAPSR